MKKIVAGIIADVDAGKTTLSEALLYKSGSLKKLGRVDHGNAHLDTNDLEKKRGITIFSHQTKLIYQDLQLSLVDTPGHLDFISQTEAVLPVVDYIILTIAANQPLSSHTKTLWRLLQKYRVPTFIFINKIDLAHHTQTEILNNLQAELSASCTLLTDDESIALNDERLLTQYLENSVLTTDEIAEAIRIRRIYPVLFGSALKLTGVEELLANLASLMQPRPATEELSYHIFKISHDDKNERLTWLRLLGGQLATKELLGSEKIQQIRSYDGDKFELVSQAGQGEIFVLTGLTKTYPGQVFGPGLSPITHEIQPILSYGVADTGGDLHTCLQALKILEDEDPLLKVTWNRTLDEISVQVMGEIQIEILTEILKERFNLGVIFAKGKILYKETITQAIEGVGHYEPLRHYAEAHIYLEPSQNDGQVSYDNCCHPETLTTNFQSQIITALQAKEHLGVLAGYPLGNVKLTLVGGRSHPKHTEGGDFRQATWRAVRQGLMRLKEAGACQILEPWYRFEIHVTEEFVGRVMTDIGQLGGKLDYDGSGSLTGIAPVRTMRTYPATLRAFSHGSGQIDLAYASYYPCDAQDEVIATADYEPVNDLDNTPQSVFCAHGAGCTVPWQEVNKLMHLPFYVQ
ncbi:tetracycline resistance protein [Ligilactobacillus equi DSM 15833 = JCM 10991]|uniref:Tetracycline resistance protein n=1 Tax=Ligilactobacillus equi DSM 15833 = JCM 10991 TaxID=1423740 RepID=A0A0R1T4F6_9LACO|nr:TetM/TetW/TetO/TetS family tetracycline resistance ribosomal protection protein [Ligilactobacillus equi]KRL76662.1 tetracycline resistance protein [Ligilactobacillus equi DSM 15833 = JCM 10991]